ncbi:MAG TPA: hypothetical protein VJI13_02515 [Candidatus Norongarragalinales archaeon]|nr:hypothetical protein [Candidatus Norongarragalinales archaeon]
MDMKFIDFDAVEFVMPRPGKLAVMVSLLLISTVLSVQQQCGGVGNATYCVDKLGFPASVYGLYKEGDLVLGKDLNDLNKGFLFGIAANIIFYYILACLFLYAYGRFTGKGKLGEIQ